jgi:hypothetical protein
MSALTEFLHKLVDHVGASSLHGDIDALDTPADETEGKEETPNAAE